MEYILPRSRNYLFVSEFVSFRRVKNAALQNSDVCSYCADCSVPKCYHTILKKVDHNSCVKLYLLTRYQLKSQWRVQSKHLRYRGDVILKIAIRTHVQIFLAIEIAPKIAVSIARVNGP